MENWKHMSEYECRWYEGLIISTTISIFAFGMIISVCFSLFHFVIGIIVTALIVGLMIYTIVQIPKQVHLGKTQLRVVQLAKSTSIKYKDIAEVDANVENLFTWYILGVRGLFGNIGYYYDRKNKKYFSLVTNPHESILLTLKNGKKIMISVEDAEEFVEHLHAIMEAGKNVDA